MKTGLGLRQRLIKLNASFNLFRFWVRKIIIGFEFANLLTQTVDKYSLSMILKRNGAKIGKNCDIETGLVFHNCHDYSNLVIGDNCHIGKNCFFDLREKVIIGNNVVISMKCTIITHIDVNRSNLGSQFKAKSLQVNISDDAYIGANSVILMGVNIGQSAFVAANSLINKDVEPYTMVGGVPAKFIKKLMKN